jgi:hypothetical protein
VPANKPNTLLLIGAAGVGVLVYLKHKGAGSSGTVTPNLLAPPASYPGMSDSAGFISMTNLQATTQARATDPATSSTPQTTAANVSGPIPPPGTFFYDTYQPLTTRLPAK